MPTLSFSLSVSGLGGTISKQYTRSGDGGGTVEIAVPRGYAGTLSTRTDDETGTLTLADGHGISTSQVIDLYWDGGSRRNITVGTVAGNSVPIGADNSGDGDDLPTENTEIVASSRVEFNAAIDGDEVSLFAMQMYYPTGATETAVSHLSLEDDDDNEIEAYNLTANIPHVIDVDGGHENTLTGSPIEAGVISNASATYDAVLKMMWVQDATP